MTKQDEKLRLRRRLQERAVDLAAKNRWADAVEINRQIISLGEDVDAYNRLGKALFELGQLQEAREAYQSGLQLAPANGIARKNLERLDELIARANIGVPDRKTRQLVDLRVFITETGKTALTTLVDVPRGPIIDAVVTGEKVELRQDGRHVVVIDADENVLGRLEPKLAQRLSELMSGGNRYAAAIAQTNGHQLRVILREVYQDPSQRDRISFPGKFGESSLRGYVSGATYDEYAEDLLEEDESLEEAEEIEEEVFGGEEEELGLEDIEPDMPDDEDISEE